ncbi:MAG TPA: histidine--tRNA ligase [Ktedonobacteraceae bacterium]|nr:histidine--tRNA ligase [Ktedonobacteraceae bacterium]
MSQQYKALQGFKDILPDDQIYWRLVEQVAVEVAETFGYRRIDTPTLEETSLYRRTSGEGTDVVEKEMYSFDDRPDKEGHRTNITMRSEGTAGVVRAYLEHGMFQMVQPVKLYYLSVPIFRHDKPQAGRLREHHQFGCEALGEEDPAIDAEIIGLLYQVYTRLGLSEVRVRLNSIGDANCRPQYIETLKEYYRPLLNSCCQDCQVRFVKNPLRLLDCKEPQDQAKIAAAPKIANYLCEPCKDHFTTVQRFLTLYNVPFEQDPLIVRGLDYYARTVFEFTPGGDKTALSGGGRYDGLAEILGGEHTPGIGFGAGVERIILELKKRGVKAPEARKPQAFVVTFGKTSEYREAAVQLAAQLRQAGIQAELSYGGRSSKAQMKQANASGSAYALLLGENELAGGFVTVKDLQAQGLENEKKQVEIRREELVEFLLQAGEQ